MPESNASVQAAAQAATQQPGLALWLTAGSLAAWGALIWLVVDMGHPLARLTMPPSAHWQAANLVAVALMWAIMMAAMMLPSALPTVLAFGQLCAVRGEGSRWRAFVVAYLLVWSGFSLVAVAVQWLLQWLGWIDPMLASTSSGLTATLLLIAGIYQFSSLKRACLKHCRTPLGFLLGEWRPGTGGAFRMGWRHGVICLGCCWALMVLLFVGGVMNLAWIAALAMIVAVEKLAPRGAIIAGALGAILITIGGLRLLSLLA